MADVSLYKQEKRKLFYLQAHVFVMHFCVLYCLHTIVRKYCYMFVKSSFEFIAFFLVPFFSR